MAAKILIIDDEPLLVKGLKHRLKQEGFQVVCAYDGEEGLEKAKDKDLDLIILDVMLPKIDGFTLCKEIRRTSNIPIIMLTAKGEDVDKIVGIEIGADDYLTKPFNTRELIARIKALLRRVKMPYTKEEGAQKEAMYQVGDLRLDFSGRRVFLNDKEIELTSKEFEILTLLARHPGRVYSRQSLLEQVWGYDYMGDTRTVDVHIRRLREKLEEDPSSPHWILTKWGTGYYFKEMI